MDSSNFPRVDPLGDALGFLHLSETAYYHSELSAPWGLVMPENCPKFHFVMFGGCWLQTAGSDPLQLKTGDFAVIPHGKGHRLASDPAARSFGIADLRCEKISERFAMFTHAGTGPITVVVCGDLNFGHPAADHLLSLLPKVMHVKAPADRPSEWLRSTMRLMAEEARDLRPGGEAIITRLADILVVQAIRSWIEQNPAEQVGWLAALQDRGISRALGLIHRDPGREWTVNELARAVAMSRSSLSARFSGLVGESVKQYVTRWRMHLARKHLQEPSRTLEEIAALIGYQSGAAFSRAFKRSVGVAPGEVRREVGGGVAALREPQVPRGRHPLAIKRAAAMAEA